MRLVRFSTTDETGVRLGVHRREEKCLVDLHAVSEALDIGLPATMRGLLAQPKWQEKVALLDEYGYEADLGQHRLDAVDLLAPLDAPQKIVCVGLNYLEHVEEGDEDPPENPILFSKYPSSIVGPNDAISWKPRLTSQVDYEVELAVVMGDRAREVEQTEAREYVAGYTVANDVSARDLQFADEQWTRGKSLDTFCPLGPALVTRDDIPDPHDLKLWTDVNGERLQESRTDQLIFDIDEIVSFCSQSLTLVPGDVILTGTPPGVGVFREPQRLLDDGDDVTVAVEGVGRLTNVCKHD